MFATEPRPPLNGRLLALICAIFLLAGTIGHDPWKIDDAIHLGVAWEFAGHGDWLNPRIGHEAWLATPPLYHWVAALCGKALSFLLPFHDAARLATTLFGALLLFGLALAARTLDPRIDSAWPAPLLAIGTLGLLVPIHDAQPAIAQLAAQTFVYVGIALLRTRAAVGAMVAGGALGVGLWSGGLLALPALLPPFLFVVLHRDWRAPRILAMACAALALGIAIASLWPLLLLWQAPWRLLPWWHAEQARFGVYASEPRLLKDHVELLTWFAWPILPLALWSLWVRRRALAEAAMLLPLLGCVFAAIQFFLVADPKPLPALPLIVPLVLLAVPGAMRLRRGAANAFDWFGIMTFTFVASLVWLGGVSIATRLPWRVAKNFYKAEPGFEGHLSIPAFVAAALLTLAWLGILFGTPRSPWRSATRWAAGVTLMWGLVATLWLPWIDYGKSYRPVARSLAHVLDRNPGCVAGEGVGYAQKASLRYFIGLKTHAADRNNRCPLLLVQGAKSKEPELKGMRKIWEGYRGGDKSERLRLYRRQH